MYFFYHTHTELLFVPIRRPSEGSFLLSEKSVVVSINKAVSQSGDVWESHWLQWCKSWWVRTNMLPLISAFYLWLPSSRAAGWISNFAPTGYFLQMNCSPYRIPGQVNPPLPPPLRPPFTLCTFSHCPCLFLLSPPAPRRLCWCSLRQNHGSDGRRLFVPRCARGRVAARRHVETLLRVPPCGPADRQEGPDVSGLTGSLVQFVCFFVAWNLNRHFFKLFIWLSQKTQHERRRIHWVYVHVEGF